MDGFDHILNWKLKEGSHPFPGILALSALAWLWPASTAKLGPGETTVAKRNGAPSEAGDANETSSLSGQPANAKRTWPVPDEPPGLLRGVPEVIDTATIRVEGKVVRPNRLRGY